MLDVRLPPALPRLRGALDGERSIHSFHLGYRPALDGLRAIAILAVMIYHAGLLLGGWAGVDVFFALSGFLITSLLIEEHRRTGRIALRQFYARRLLRLLPALIVCVAVVGGVSYALHPDGRARLAVILGSVLFYVANWAMIGGIKLGLFGHTWSLAIEEQFYLLWPPLLIVLLRWVRRPGAIGVLLLALAAASAGYRLGVVWTTPPTPYLTMRLFAGLDVRADSLLVGCALAALAAGGVLERLPRVASASLGIVGILGLATIFAAARFSVSFYAYGLSTVTALATTLVMADTLRPGSWLSRCLGARPLVLVGRISYGLYLWHFSVFYLAGTLNVYSNRFVAPPLAALVLGWVGTFVVAAVSYWLVERRALELKARFQPSASIPASEARRPGPAPWTPMPGTVVVSRKP